MVESSLSLATLLGLGGVLGVAAGVYTAGRRFSAKLSELANSLEKSLRDPRSADIPALVQKIREVEKDAKSLLGMMKHVFKTKSVH